MKNLAFKDILLKNNFFGETKTGELLAGHSSMHVGGRAELFLEPFDEKSLILALDAAASCGLKYFLAGGGSNVVFPDEGLNLVICTRKLGKDESVKLLENNRIICSAGTGWGSVLNFCKKNNLGGLEAFTALSGTTGGAVFMNACCFGLAASDRLLSVRYFDTQKNEILTYKTEKNDWDYKKSPFQPCKKMQKGGVAGDFPPLEGEAENAEAVGAGGRLSPPSKKIILSAEFSVTSGFDDELSLQVKQKRSELGHFRAPSCGSAFKNDPERKIVAGKLIDECGFKGFSVGGAQIAPWHANFIINPEQKARSADILELVGIVQEAVLKKQGVFLEPEIIFA